MPTHNAIDLRTASIVSEALRVCNFAMTEPRPYAAAAGRLRCGTAPQTLGIAAGGLKAGAAPSNRTSGDASPLSSYAARGRRRPRGRREIPAAAGELKADAAVS